MADYYIDQGMEEDRYDDLFDISKKELIWTTRDGERIPLSKIKDDHLANIIPHIERRIKKLNSDRKIKANQRVLKIMIAEQELRKKVKNNER